MSVTRRKFLGGVLTLVGASMIPAAALKAMERVSPLPILYGDGVHDDVEAVEALFNGRPFRTADGFAGYAESGTLMDATIRVSRAIQLCRADNIIMVRCHIFCDWSAPEKAMAYQHSAMVRITRERFL